MRERYHNGDVLELDGWILSESSDEALDQVEAWPAAGWSLPKFRAMVRWFSFGAEGGEPGFNSDVDLDPEPDMDRLRKLCGDYRQR